MAAEIEASAATGLFDTLTKDRSQFAALRLMLNAKVTLRCRA